MDSTPLVVEKRDLYHYLIQGMNGVQLIFFMVFFVMIPLDHDNINLPTLQFSTAMESENFMPVMNLEAPRNSVGVCDRDTPRDFERCAMSKLPRAFTSPRSELSIWPGASMNKPFLLFIICAINLSFCITFTSTVSNNWHRVMAAMKSLLLCSVHIASLAMVGVFKIKWGVSYSSICIGLIFTLLAMLYSWSYMYTESKSETKKSTIANAIERNISMQYHTIRVLCTFPVIVYVVLIDLNPQYMDFMYNVNAIFAVVLTLCQLMIENRLFIKTKKNGTEHVAFFKTEKMVYILAVIVSLVAYMISMGNAASFYDIAHTPGAAPEEAQLTYKLLFFIKLIETAMNLIFFFLDEVQTLGRNTVGRHAWKPDENFMKNTSNGRYVVWTISEFVIVATLFIQFTITASA